MNNNSSTLVLLNDVLVQREQVFGEDTDPGAFDLLKNIVELQCVCHLGYRRRLMLYRKKH